jgi:hypothetical protein
VTFLQKLIVQELPIIGPHTRVGRQLLLCTCAVTWQSPVQCIPNGASNQAARVLVPVSTIQWCCAPAIACLLPKFHKADLYISARTGWMVVQI